MMRAITKAVLPALAFLLVMELGLVGAIEFWPEIEANLGALKFFTKIPVLRDLLSILQEGELPGYIVFQHFFKGNLLAVVAAVLFAVNAVAGEAHRGTLEILLARPVSRTRILLERYFIGVLQVVIPIMLSTWSIPFLLMARHEEVIELEPLMLGAVHMCCSLLAVHATTFFLSTVGRHPIRITIVVLFFCIFQLALYLMMEATNYSLVRFVDPRLFIDIFATKKIDWTICGGMLGYTALCLSASIFAFRRRLP